MKQRDWSAPALFIFFCVLYVATAAKAYSYDGLCYALDVEFGTLAQVFHPNHLLYSFFMKQLYHFSGLLGFHDRAIFLMQSANAFLAAGAVALFGFILSSHFQNSKGYAASLILGFSYAFWSEVIDPGCYALATLATVILLGLLLRTKGMHPFLVGLCHGLSILVHQMLVLAAPAFLFQLSSPKNQAQGTVLGNSVTSKVLPVSVALHKLPSYRGPSPQVLLKRWGAYAAGLCLGVLPVYGVVAFRYHGGSLREVIGWIIGPAGTPQSTPIFSYWWSLDWANNLKTSWDQMALSWVMRPSHDALWVGLRWVITGVLFFLGLRSARLWKQKEREGRTLLSLWIWVITMSTFQLFYNPGALRFRLLFLPALLFIGVQCVAKMPGPWGTRFAFVLAGAMALHNFNTGIRPSMVSPPAMQRIRWVKEFLGPRDFLLFSGDGAHSVENVYMAYFAHEVPARSMHGYFTFNPGLGRLVELSEGLSDLSRSGSRIMVEKDLLDPDWGKSFERAAHLPPGAMQSWIRGLKTVQVYNGPEGFDLVQVSPTFHPK